MKVLKIADEMVYVFNCPNCGSRLEADCAELTDIGNKISKFDCPICCKERYIPWSSLRKKTRYR